MAQEHPKGPADSKMLSQIHYAPKSTFEVKSKVPLGRAPSTFNSSVRNPGVPADLTRKFEDHLEYQQKLNQQLENIPGEQYRDFYNEPDFYKKYSNIQKKKFIAKIVL